DANVTQAKCVVLATTDDLANLEIALDAKRLAPRVRVVMRMFDQNMANKIQDGFDIQMAMSQAAISAPAFALKAIEPSIMGGVVVGDRLIVSIRLSVREGSPLAGRAVGEVIEHHGCGIIERRRDGHSWLFPPPKMTLQVGDEILLEGPYERVSEVRKLVEEAAGGGS